MNLAKTMFPSTYEAGIGQESSCQVDENVRRDADILNQVVSYVDTHQKRWQSHPEEYWYYRLVQEVGELGSVLAKDHSDTKEHELKQIASIAINWLRKIST